MSVRLIIGDALDQLRLLPGESVHCCVTSPPYFGLRDYGTAQWDGGDAGCDHTQKRNMGATTLRLDGREHLGVYDGEKATEIGTPYRGACGKCGARRIDQQIGLEPSPDEYVAALVSVFRELRRVLRRDGTLWLNVGDSYATSNPAGRRDSGDGTSQKFGACSISGSFGSSTRRQTGLKPKDLIGIPWMLAFALRADGWYLRQDIIWSKPNPMPESVTDRCTKAHEYLFLLSRSERYFYDAAAIAEPFADERMGNPGAYKRTTSKAKGAVNDRQDLGFLNNGDGWNADGSADSRNKRSVWVINSSPFSEAHFATFPPALIEPCILAGCPRGGTVLDPFGGAGTTGLVADRLGRNAVLIELNPEYAVMAERRIYRDGPLFADVAIAVAVQ